MPAITGAASQDQFLTLLVTQLQHQDPINPVKQEDFLGQLAQFATLEGVETLNGTFEDMLRLQELSQGSNLIGRTVEFTTLGANPTLQTGLVEQVTSTDGSVSLIVDGESIGLSEVTRVS